jgi:hypothetical protein
MGNANSLLFFHSGERKGCYTVLKLKQGKIGEDTGNKMKFPFVHFCFDHISGKGSAGERMEGDCSIPFMSFFK